MVYLTQNKSINVQEKVPISNINVFNKTFYNKAETSYETEDIESYFQFNVYKRVQNIF